MDSEPVKLELTEKNIDTLYNDIESYVDKIKSENTIFNKFNKFKIVNNIDHILAISDLFDKDKIDDYEYKAKPDVVSYTAFKVIRDDFCIVNKRYMEFTRLMVILYNDEKVIEKEIFEKIKEFTGYNPGTYNLSQSNGCYLLNEDKVCSEEKVILEGDIEKEIDNDIEHFFNNRNFYEKEKIAYKRGILLYGPPGTGKTSMIKKIINNKDIFCINVPSNLIGSGLGKFLNDVTSGRGCIITIEDIDSIAEYDKSTFLNLLDGVYGVDGMFVIATTNYISQLDPAIVNRPSRFDKTYLFDTPNEEVRKKIIKSYFKDIDEEKLKLATFETKDFTGAYIKEIFIQCGIQGIDILEAIKNVKKRSKQYMNYKEPCGMFA